ncbi:MAG: TonB-dependent receptor [Polyangiaceae bacterium]|jgi:TonB family protein|nr:TonB-dependent receptor [Polyangiaceae bacterium]
MHRALPPLLALSLLLAPGALSAQSPPGNAAAPRLTRAPRLSRFVEAPFPEQEKAAGRGAVVLLRIAISATGTVDAVDVVESGGAAFDAAALAAARQFLFEPAELDGKPAPVRIAYRYEFLYRVEEKKIASFSGLVRARGTRAPLAGVRVSLSSGASATTDAQGQFSFPEVTPGKTQILLEGEGLTALRTEETFEAGKKVEATYDVQLPSREAGEEEDVEIVVTAPPVEKNVVITAVNAEQGRRVPGTQGDVLKVVESMPGVGRAAAGSGALVVWGAAPQDTRVYIDQVRVPALYHFGGLRSVVSSELVRSVELAPGGYGASFGRGLGGLVTIQTRPLEPDGFHGALTADLLDASAALRWGGPRWRWFAAGRRSHLHSALDPINPGKISEIFPIPRYHDAQLLGVHEFSPQERLVVGGLLSHDEVDRGSLDQNPRLLRRERQSLGWRRLFFRYERQLSDGATVSVTPAIGDESHQREGSFGGVPVRMTTDSTYYALRASYRGRVSSFLNVSVGMDAELMDTRGARSGAITSPPREGDVLVFGQIPAAQVNSDRWRVQTGSASPYAEADWGLLDDRLHIIQGLRLEPFVLKGDRRAPLEGETPAVGYLRQETSLQPRFAVRFAPERRLLFKAAYGVYAQAPGAEELSPVFGNPTLRNARATHWLGGLVAQLLEGLSLDATVFLTRSGRLPLRSPLEAPLQAEALVDQGQGRAFGAQVMLRKEPSRGFFGWVSYSIARSERRASPTGPFRLFDLDQTHVLTALGAYELGRGFEVGVRLRLATGFPRTPVIDAFYDAQQDRVQPIFGAQNSTRIPWFFQADIRGSRRFKLGAGSELELSLDVQNVTYRRNVEEFIYSQDYRQRLAINGLPLLPVLGARLSW